MLSLYGVVGVNRTTDQMGFLIWPTQMLAAYESRIGRVLALTMALISNALLFSVIGALVGCWSSTRTRIVAFYMSVVAVAFGWALWGAGVNARFLDGLGLAVSFGLYAIPFLFVAKTIPVQTT